MCCALRKDVLVVCFTLGGTVLLNLGPPHTESTQQDATRRGVPSPLPHVITDPSFAHRVIHVTPHTESNYFHKITLEKYY